MAIFQGVGNLQLGQNKQADFIFWYIYLLMTLDLCARKSVI